MNVPFSHKEGRAWRKVQHHIDECGTCIFCVELTK